MAVAGARRLGAAHRQLAHTNLLVDRHDRFCMAGPALGAPAAVLLMEKLVALGVKRMVLLSCCGVLDPSLSIGDVLVAKRAIIGEGVSRWYGAADQAGADPEMIGGIERILTARGLTWRRGVVWSTDARTGNAVRSWCCSANNSVSPVLIWNARHSIPWPGFEVLRWPLCSSFQMSSGPPAGDPVSAPTFFGGRAGSFWICCLTAGCWRYKRWIQQ